MEIRIRSTGQVMYEDEFRRWAKDNDGPSWQATTPEVLEALGADPVFEGPQPATSGPYEYVTRQGVEQQSDGKWYTKYVVQTLDDEGKAAKDIEISKNMRDDRNRRLSETDWRFRSDMTPSQEWKDYCQALRDLPAQAGFPHNVTWPNKPE
jgi:hypothetical protein